MDGSANVTRPTASFLIWQNPKSTLRHPMHRPRERAFVVCAALKPTLLEGYGRRGARRSGIKKEAEGRVTAAELSAPSARSWHVEGVWPVIIEGKFHNWPVPAASPDYRFIQRAKRVQRGPSAVREPQAHRHDEWRERFRVLLSAFTNNIQQNM